MTEEVRRTCIAKPTMSPFASMPRASESMSPAGRKVDRSTALAAVPVQSRAWVLPPVVGPTLPEVLCGRSVRHLRPPGRPGACGLN